MKYTQHRISLRIPVELHKQLAEEAEEKSRSINAEVIERLQSSFEQSKSINGISESRMEELIREAIRKELKKSQ